jgi:2-polyprenyl-3-methyl-5-hydroxy-6-metoxy-1,4-benzoquinol methylase
LLAACGEVAGRRVLDLGCGQGWFTRQLAARGAIVTGIDFSAQQLANAHRHAVDQPLGISYLHLDATRIAEQWAPASFDLVTACMMLHDSPHADRILQAARQVLADDGRLAFSIVHPVVGGPHTDWEVLAEGQKGAPHWSTPQWHRTLAEWSALIADAGFAIVRLDEPRPTAAQVRDNPKLVTATRVPFFLVLVLCPV